MAEEVLQVALPTRYIPTEQEAGLLHPPFAQQHGGCKGQVFCRIGLASLIPNLTQSTGRGSGTIPSDQRKIPQHPQWPLYHWRSAGELSFSLVWKNRKISKDVVFSKVVSQQIFSDPPSLSSYPSSSSFYPRTNKSESKRSMSARIALN